MKALLVVCNELLRKYEISGPFEYEICKEQVALLDKRQEYTQMIILMCDGRTKNQNKDLYEKYLRLLDSSKLRCRKEAQVVTMEYFIGSHLSQYVSIESFPAPTDITYDDTFAPREVKKTDVADNS